LSRWLGRELSGVLAYADEKGRDAFAFEPIQSRYLEVAEDLRVRTPYSKTVVAELRAVPWAWWDRDARAWRVPFRSWPELRERWRAIEAAAERNEPAERQKRRDARKGTAQHDAIASRASESRRRRHPVPADALPPLDRVVMTTQRRAVIFVEVTGELADEGVVDSQYPGVGSAHGPLVWANWRKPTHDELVKSWPSRWPASEIELSRGWWQPTLEELRDERRKARAIERSLATRRLKGPGPPSE
jgi:hypothetical protein